MLRWVEHEKGSITSEPEVSDTFVRMCSLNWVVVIRIWIKGHYPCAAVHFCFFILSVTADLLQYNTIMLVCDGLDTVSTVYINNKSVGASDNMFVRYSFNIKQYLQVQLTAA